MKRYYQHLEKSGLKNMYALYNYALKNSSRLHGYFFVDSIPANVFYIHVSHGMIKK